MRAVVGNINDSCYMDFNLQIAGGKPDDWYGDKALAKGSQSLLKGKFKSTNGDVELNDKAYLNYKDILNSVQIVFVESRLAPLVRIRIGLPNSDKYHVSEFFTKGHFEIERITIENLKKTVQGVTIMHDLNNGKKINILDKLIIEKMGDPLLRMDVTETSMGNIQQIKTKANIEI